MHESRTEILRKVNADTKTALEKMVRKAKASEEALTLSELRAFTDDYLSEASIARFIDNAAHIQGTKLYESKIDHFVNALGRSTEDTRKERNWRWGDSDMSESAVKVNAYIAYGCKAGKTKTYVNIENPCDVIYRTPRLATYKFSNLEEE